MAEYTPNVKLYKPNRADSDIEVDISLSENFTKIDEYLAESMKGIETVASHGIISDSATDQTQALIDLFSTGVLANYEGMIVIPYGTMFDIKQVYPKIPLDAVVRDESMLNYPNTSGYKSKVITIGASDKQPNDSSFQIMSGQHPTLIINNLGTATDDLGNLTDSAAKHNSSILYAFGLDAGKNIMASFRAHSIVESSKFLYRISNEREYLNPSTVNSKTLFTLDEEGKSGFNANPLAGVTHYIKQQGTSTTTTVLIENSLNSSKSRLQMQSKDSGGVIKRRYIDLENNGDLVIRGTSAEEHLRILADGTLLPKTAFVPPKYTTANRPTGLPQGAMVYDTTIFKPIWYYGNGQWRDATGAVV